MEIKLDWDDISIIPSNLSDIDSRSEIDTYLNDKLPIFTAPMDTVISIENMDVFYEQGMNICLPRGLKTKNLNYFISYGLDEIIDIFDNDKYIHNKVLIDIANGNMIKLYNISKKIKNKYGNKVELMIGNIANPETYRKYCEIGVDYIRCGIGGGSACTTSANVSIHYPMASLIIECHEISKEFDNPTKIIADGGFKKFSDIIKALALGSNYVMIGGILSKTFESCSDFFEYNNGEYNIVNYEEAKTVYESGRDIYKYYRGMSTKEVQKSWNRKEIKTGEGISKYNKVEYTLSGWRENFEDYLRSAMSYTNSRTLNDFIGKVKYTTISQNSFNRFNK